MIVFPLDIWFTKSIPYNKIVYYIITLKANDKTNIKKKNS